MTHHQRMLPDPVAGWIPPAGSALRTVSRQRQKPASPEPRFYQQGPSALQSRTPGTLMRAICQRLEPRLLLSAVYTTLLADDFSSSSLNLSAWHLPAFDPGGSTFLGRTQLKTVE